MSKRLKWFWKTLFGYKVTIVTPHTTYHIHHRPFRSPGISREITGMPNHRHNFHTIYFDEAEYMKDWGHR